LRIINGLLFFQTGSAGRTNKFNFTPLINTIFMEKMFAWSITNLCFIDIEKTYHAHFLLILWMKLSYIVGGGHCSIKMRYAVDDSGWMISKTSHSLDH